MKALTLAIPSKGRLQEQVRDYFRDAGIPLKQAAGSRGYRATLEGFPGHRRDAAFRHRRSLRRWRSAKCISGSRVKT